MTDLNQEAIQYLHELAIPPGPGIDSIRSRGYRRRRRLLVIKLTGAALAVSFLVAGILALIGDEPIWDESQLPTVPTPAAPGWETVVQTVDVHDRHTTASIGIQYYFRRADEQLKVGVLSGQIDLSAGGRTVTLDRPSGSIDASLTSDADGSTLTWNERPGVNTGTTVMLSGSSTETLLVVAEDLIFDDLPLVGATEPKARDLPSDREVLLAGTVSGIDWQISQSGLDDPILELDQIAPQITSMRVRVGNGLDAAITTVSKDGVQLSMIRMPTNATAFLAAGDGINILLPSRIVDEADYALAVAPIPAGKQA
ncbi:MAG: hypothetical protein GY939_02050, partial [Actinomycetia bacterium]|nr:hypothetical protein [Actinomycetes bacterium]